MSQELLFQEHDQELVNLRQAAEWAAKYTNHDITPSNISYLIQYGRVKKYDSHGSTLINKEELRSYYDSFNKEAQWKNKLGKDLNWRLSFVEYREKERTKHVHRLHPYKGKFIPQLVEYFLDTHIDEFKKEVYFRRGDIVLDPFCGSGTTLVQANELGLHAVGTDISLFNCMIANTKVEKHDIPLLAGAIRHLTSKLEDFQKDRSSPSFEQRLLSELARFNSEHFPSPDYKRKISMREIDEADYAGSKEKEFLPIYFSLADKFQVKIQQDKDSTFLDKWLLLPVREEVDFLFEELKKFENKEIKKILAVILSRTVRSCRATTHADLGTLKEPVTTTYYCKKHGKMCKPIFSISSWWKRYSIDTLNRLNEFKNLKTETNQFCLQGDSRSIDIFRAMDEKCPDFAKILMQDKIRGIFSSPPYVGLIDYHEQHAYAYELFGFDRSDQLEIGPLFKGQGKNARDSYTRSIAEVLKNSRQYLQDNYDIFLVANDKYNLYPEIADLAGMEIVNRFKRPVLNRVEKDRSNAYSEIIFHLKER